MRAAIDDTFARFERTSEAYHAGFAAGAQRMHRAARGIVEQAIWNSERAGRPNEERTPLVEMLSSMDRLDREEATPG